MQTKVNQNNKKFVNEDSPQKLQIKKNLVLPLAAISAI